MELLYIFFGWLLGIVGSFLIDYYRTNKIAKRSLDVIGGEIYDLQVRLALVYYLNGSKRSLVDIPGYRWVNNILSDYDGPLLERELSELLKTISAHDDNEIAVALKSQVAPESKRTGLHKYDVPILRSRLSDLIHLNTDTARRLIEIVVELELYNQQVDLYRYWFDKTFDSTISKENYKIVNDNLNTAETTIVWAAMKFAKKIEKLRSSLQ